MRFENHSNLQIPKIGFGTWRIGGGNDADYSSDDRSLAALRSALDLGYTLFDTAESYAAGHAEELLGRAIRESGIPRHKLLITSKVSPTHLRSDSLLKACANSLRNLAMDYIDLYLIHWPGFGVKLEETFRALNQLVKVGQVRHLGVSNFNQKLLQRAVSLSETPLLTNQVPYSLTDRSYVKNGVLAYCQQNDILLTAYSPIKHLGQRNKKPLQIVAQARNLPPEEVALAWLVSQPRVITIPMSFDPAHQALNLAAADVTLTPEELSLLDGV